MKILTDINLKVHEAEKVAIVDPENYGRNTLLNLILMTISKDTTTRKLSFFELFGKRVEFSSPCDLRKDMMFLSEYPALYSGSV